MTQGTQKKLSIKPLGDRVVAQRLEAEETTKGGIILPDSAKKKQETVRILATGKGKVADDGKVIPIPVNVGDIVLVDRYAGQEVTLDDEEYVVFKSDDIIAVVER